jgi:hypothetical protein
MNNIVFNNKQTINSSKKKKLYGAWLEGELIHSYAFRDLSQTALFIYIHFVSRLIKESKGKGHNKKWSYPNSKELVFSYKEAKERFGLTQPRFTRGIDDLIEHGFVDIIKNGNGTVQGDVTIYGISDRWRKYGTPEFQAKPRLKVKKGFCRTK